MVGGALDRDFELQPPSIHRFARLMPVGPEPNNLHAEWKSRAKTLRKQPIYATLGHGRFAAASVARRAALLLAGLASCALVSACGTTRTPEPRVVYQEVRIAVPTPCNPSLRPEPAYPEGDAQLAAEPDVLAGVRDLRIGRELRIARIAEIMSALAACRDPTAH